jgi:hypothetical protein
MAQLLIWVLLSIFGGLFAYLVLTEGKNNLLLIICLLFNLSSGTLTSYLYIQMTGGLAMFSSALFLMPLIISTIATILLLLYYRVNHPSMSFPKHMKFKVGPTQASIALVIIVCISMVFAVTSLPGPSPAPSIATIGSTGDEEISADDVVNTTDCIDCLKSSDIMIQSSMISPTSMRDDPIQGEYLNFKVELAKNPEYLQPSLKIFVQDVNKELINESNIIAYPQTGNVLEGQIYCDQPGIYTITVAVYDLAVSQISPLATNTLSYTVSSSATGAIQPTNFFSTAMLIMLLSIVILIWVVAIYKRYG